MSHVHSTPPSDDAHRAGDRVGRWELVRCIGVGGMGSVWEARHATLSRRVAVKFIHAEHVADEEARQRFETEAKAASALQSRHVVAMFDHGLSESGEPFIVMEYLVGESLEAKLRRDGPLSISETAAVIVQAARALQQAHDLGIIHRDLKPDNLFLTPDEEPGPFCVKVLDFGIAKVSGASAVLGDAKTRTGVLLGTPYYMAPEQARGAKDIDPRADVWALGVIAYRCVTNALPFDAEALGELLVRICTGVYTPPGRVTRDSSPAFDAWLARMLRVDPRQRFASATEAARALADLAAAHGGLDQTFNRALSRSPGHATPVPPTRSMDHTEVSALAATQASLPPNTSRATVLEGRGDEVRTGTRRRAGRRMRGVRLAAGVATLAAVIAAAGLLIPRKRSLAVSPPPAIPAVADAGAAGVPQPPSAHAPTAVEAPRSAEPPASAAPEGMPSQPPPPPRRPKKRAESEDGPGF